VKQGQLPFYITTAVPTLGEESASALAVQRLIATINEIKRIEERPVLMLFIDTLASCLGGGNENGDGMIALTNAAKAIAAATGVCVVLIHHPSKGDSGAARGHTSLPGTCDSILLVEKEPNSEARRALLIKSRDHASGAEMRFALRPIALTAKDSFGDALTTVVVETAAGIPVKRARPKGKNPDALLTDLERQHRCGKTHFTEAEILQAAKALGMADRNRNAARNALRALIEAGHIIGAPYAHALRFPPETPQ
jgi:hypothetical protein